MKKKKKTGLEQTKWSILLGFGAGCNQNSGEKNPLKTLI